MTSSEIAALAARFGLDTAAGLRLQTLADALLSDPAAPIAPSTRSAVVDHHLADALVALELPEISAADTLVDVGSGAGIPALPLAIALPSTEVTALDSNARKAAFVDRAAARCGLGNVTALAARAEAWVDGTERFDVVAARALAPLPVVAEYAAPLLRMGGVLVAWRGRRDPEDERAGAVAAAELGLEPDRVVRVFPFATAQHRHLHVLRKAVATPARFPRRVGVARKRPLGASV